MQGAEYWKWLLARRYRIREMVRHRIWEGLCPWKACSERPGGFWSPGRSLVTLVLGGPEGAERKWRPGNGRQGHQASRREANSSPSYIPRAGLPKWQEMASSSSSAVEFLNFLRRGRWPSERTVRFSVIEIGRCERRQQVPVVGGLPDRGGSGNAGMR